MQMEKEEKNDRGTSLMTMRPPPETDFFLQWGNRKRLRCVRIRSNNTSPPHLSSSSPHLSSSNSTRIRRRITSRFLSVTSNDEKHLSFPQPSSRLTRNSEAAVTLRSESRRVSPEKEERTYTTRGSVPVLTNLEESGGVKVTTVDVNGRVHGAAPGNQGGDGANYYHMNYKNDNYSNRGGGGTLAWPKLCITLSSKEKEEDFLAMKGCKLPQRPKKRAKLIQRTILLVCPGAWLSDMSLERYEVREKKTSKKRPRGLKAMGNMESDSE